MQAHALEHLIYLGPLAARMRRYQVGSDTSGSVLIYYQQQQL